MKTLYLLVFYILSVMAEDVSVLNEYRQGNLEFSAKTYKELAKGHSGNFLTSPLSVSVVLALVEAGSRGETANQILTGLNLPNTEEKTLKAFKEIAPSLNVDGAYTLTSANKVYVKNGYSLNPEFKKIATGIFHANVEEIDFTSGSAAAEINKWVYEKTGEKIKDIINNDALNSDTRAVLINALYFHGLWINPFEVQDTKFKDFHLNSKSKVKVKMMEQIERFNFYHDEKLKAKYLQMRYERGDIWMTVVLPDDIDGLPDLEKNIQSVLARPNYSFVKVHVQIPHVDIEHTIDFIPILKEFGVKDIFDSNADLSRMLLTDEKIKIDAIAQKTFIKVEEKGTTAAAATAAIAVAESINIDLHPMDPKEFEANHPFIFIVESREGILFVGRYNTPK